MEINTSGEADFEKYVKLKAKYLQDAESLLGKKDYAQASEKLWGAAAEIVKAVAAKRGWMMGSHERLWDVVEELDREHPELRIAEGFSLASSLHTNFYEGWMPPGIVERNSKAVKAFIETVQRLL